MAVLLVLTVGVVVGTRESLGASPSLTSSATAATAATATAAAAAVTTQPRHVETPSILMLYTGGTIGMNKTASGYAPVPGFLESLMDALPCFKAPGVPSYRIVEYSPLLDSSNMVPDNWAIIAHDIATRYYNDYAAFIVIHGTDTLAYTASALSFLLRSLNKTVVITGSQIPLVEPYSDATNNLLGALELAASHPNLPEVVVFFHGRVLQGNRIQKLTAWGFDAFEAGQIPPLGRWGGALQLTEGLILPSPTDPLSLYANVSSHVVMVLLYPGISGAMVRNIIMAPEIEGVVLLAFGMGNGPDANKEFMDALRAANASGVVIVDATQCFKGVVDLTHYATGNALAEAGCIGAMDMTPEASFTKLAWLLGRTDWGPRTKDNAPRLQAIKALLPVNVRGELTGPLTPEPAPPAAVTA